MVRGRMAFSKPLLEEEIQPEGAVFIAQGHDGPLLAHRPFDAHDLGLLVVTLVM